MDGEPGQDPSCGTTIAFADAVQGSLDRGFHRAETKSVRPMSAGLDAILLAIGWLQTMWRRGPSRIAYTLESVLLLKPEKNSRSSTIAGLDSTLPAWKRQRIAPVRRLSAPIPPVGPLPRRHGAAPDQPM